jgi:hypothetical protein
VPPDETDDRTYGTHNADFKKAGTLNAYQRPFYARLMVKLEF